MRKWTTVGVVLLGIFAIAGVLWAQQEFPNVSAGEVVLENDKVIVQKLSFETGTWAGEHSHEGGQLVVIIEPVKMLYKENGKEVERKFKPGDVFWIDPVKHDHKALKTGTAMLVSFK